MSIREGTEVSWRWGNGTASGVVTSVRDDRVTRTSKASEVDRA